MIVRSMLAAIGSLAVVLLFGSGSGQAQGVPAEPDVKPPFTVQSFSSVYGSDALPSPLGGGMVSLIGEAESKTFGVSFNGTLTSSASLTGKEKLVASLYIKCDGQAPGSRVTVGTVDLGVLKPAQPARAVMAIGEATAFVPLASIKCVSLALRIDEPDKPPFIVKTFTEENIEIAQDVKVLNSKVSLIGEPESKSFGISYRGTVESAIELSGDATVVAHLYMKCDTKPPSETSAIHVGTAKIGEAPKGRGESRRIMSADVTAFVPLREVECVKLGLQ